MGMPGLECVDVECSSVSAAAWLHPLGDACWDVVDMGEYKEGLAETAALAVAAASGELWAPLASSGSLWVAAPWASRVALRTLVGLEGFLELLVAPLELELVPVVEVAVVTPEWKPACP